MKIGMRLSNQYTDVVRRVRNLKPDVAATLEDLKLPWWAIRNETSDETTEVFVYETIGGYFGTPADEFVKALNEIDTPNIDVRINSPGGSVFDAVAIYNALVKHSANVTVYVDSLAASAASVIAMAGDKVVMMVGAQIMIHDAMGIEMGNAAEMRAFAEFLDRQSDNLASIYADRAGGETEEWRARMIAETWMFAQEAVDLGLADEIYKKPAKSDDQPSEEDDTEDGADSEEDTGDEGDNADEDVELENAMSRRHIVAGRGYKYNGRRRAPKPVSNSDESISDEELDKFINGMNKALGGK